MSEAIRWIYVVDGPLAIEAFAHHLDILKRRSPAIDQHLQISPIPHPLGCSSVLSKRAARVIEYQHPAACIIHPATADDWHTLHWLLNRNKVKDIPMAVIYPTRISLAHRTPPTYLTQRGTLCHDNPIAHHHNILLLERSRDFRSPLEKLLAFMSRFANTKP